MSNVNAVIFDAFGTLLKTQGGRHPYRELIKLGRFNGRRPQQDDIHRILCNPWTLRQTAQALGINATEHEIQLLEKVLEEETASINPFEDADEALTILIEHGFKVAVCSNLAAPYGSAIYRYFPALDAYALSYELGAVKPSPAMYKHCLEVLGTSAASTSMIGDSLSCDCDGPKSVGITGHYLDRLNPDGTGFSDLITFAHHVTKKKY